MSVFPSIEWRNFFGLSYITQRPLCNLHSAPLQVCKCGVTAAIRRLFPPVSYPVRMCQDHFFFSVFLSLPLPVGEWISLSRYFHQTTFFVTQRRAMRDGSHCDGAHAGFIVRLSSYRASTHRRFLPFLRHIPCRHDCAILHRERAKCYLWPEYVGFLFISRN